MTRIHRTHMCRVLLCCSVYLLGTDSAFGQSRISFTLPFGPYAVGFRDLQLFDSTRAVVGSDSAGERTKWRPRPVQVSMWYPAHNEPGATPMRYREYVWLSSAPMTFAANSPAARAATEQGYLNRFLLLTDRPPGWRPARVAQLDSARQREFDAPTRAFRGARAAAGPFPLLIYAPGMGGTSFENDVLLEYLASHGYVVLASPSWGAGATMGIDRLSMEAQTRDIEFLAAYGRGLPGTAGRPVGVVGHSWGGLTNVIAAGRNAVVDAVVSLDGSVRYFWSRDFVRSELLAAAPYTAPSLFLNQGANKDYDFFLRQGADTHFVYFDSLRYAPAWTISMDGIDHQNFVASFNRFSGQQRLNFVSDTAVANRAYEDVALIVRSFLDAHLKSSGTDWSPPRASAPSRSAYTIQAKPALRPLPSVASFVAAARSNGGLARAPAYLDVVRATNPAYTIPLSELSDAAWSLSTAAARAGLFEVAVALHPRNAGVRSDLAETYVAMADTLKAIAAYEHVLRLDSTSTNAREQLRRLRGQ